MFGVSIAINHVLMMRYLRKELINLKMNSTWEFTSMKITLSTLVLQMSIFYCNDLATDYLVIETYYILLIYNGLHFRRNFRAMKNLGSLSD